MTSTKSTRRCRLCDQPPRPGEQLTHRGYHQGCGLRAAELAAREMHDRAGPRYEAWLASRGPLGINRYSEGGSPHPGRSDVRQGS